MVVRRMNSQKRVRERKGHHLLKESKSRWSTCQVQAAFRCKLRSKNQKKAIELCTNRFDDATRLAFVDLFDKVSSGEMVVEETPAVSQVVGDTDIPF